MSRRIALSLWMLAAILSIMTLTATGFGALPLPVSLLWNGSDEAMRQIWLTIRLPRVLLALVIGGALALAGCVMQGLFRNPLADPGLLGISSGAALAVALWVVIPVTLPALMMLYAPMVAAFLGALAATVVIFLLSQQRHGSLSRLLLVGIAINALCGALVGVLSWLSNDAQLRQLSLWGMGSLGQAEWPTLLVAAQPDLGTSILIAASGLFVLFLSGMSWKLIAVAAVALAAFIPVLWFFLMHGYQRDRVMMLLDPESDPLGAGYHIIQSKIAIGSGGLSGKGWLHGTQSQLEFLPERHTDFIFAVLAEELGLIGVLVLLALYLLVIIRGLMIAAKAQTTFGRVMVGGLMLILFVYVFVNIGMVSGILPVVGVPLPLVSYGGSALIVLMAGFGIIMSIHTHRKMLSKSL